MIDIILGIILAYGFIRGLIKGFIVEIASLIALIIGIYGAIHFSYFLVDFLQNKLSWDEQYINISAFILTFIIIVLSIMLLAKLFTKLTRLMAMNLLNRLLGGVFGLLKMAFISGIILIYFNSFNKVSNFVDKEKISASILYRPIEQFGSKIMPSVIKKVNEHSHYWRDFQDTDQPEEKLKPDQPEQSPLNKSDH